MGDTRPSKGEFLPSDVWARNVEGWRPESKKQADNSFTLITLSVVLIAFAAASWQWLIPAVRVSDQELIDQLRGMQQRNLLMMSHLKALDQAHQSHMHSRRLLAGKKHMVENEEHWTALHATTQQLLAESEQPDDTSPPLDDSLESSSNQSIDSLASTPQASLAAASEALGASSQNVINTGSAMWQGLRQLSVNTGRSLLGALSQKVSSSRRSETAQPGAGPVTQSADTKKYHVNRVDRSAGWRKTRVDRGKKQRKNQSQGRAAAKIFRNKKVRKKGR